MARTGGASRRCRTASLWGSSPRPATTTTPSSAPAHRGNGYIDEILAEGARILSAQDVPRIRAATDLGNTPMVNAFQCVGYVNFERTINMTWN